MPIITLIGIAVIVLWLISLFIYFRASRQQHDLCQEAEHVRRLLETNRESDSHPKSKI